MSRVSPLLAAAGIYNNAAHKSLHASGRVIMRGLNLGIPVNFERS